MALLSVGLPPIIMTLAGLAVVHLPPSMFERLHDAERLLAADFGVVEGDVRRNVGGLDQAVVRDHLHAGRGGLVHRGRRRIAVFRDDDQGLDALASPCCRSGRSAV